MSANSDAMEREVKAILQIYEVARTDARPRTFREGLAVDRHFSRLMDILAGRIRHFTKVYGLNDMRDDAHQACALAVHRAIGAYDPHQARFTTFVTWQLRGELQGLRHRVRLDQRESARKIGARTVSISQTNADGEAEALTIVDDSALPAVEYGASTAMARHCANRLLDDWQRQMLQRGSGAGRGSQTPARLAAQLANERAIVASHLLDIPHGPAGQGMTSEQMRQVARRVMRHMAKSALAHAA